MGRPAKSAKTQNSRLAKEESKLRQEREDKLRGEAVLPSPPEYLTEDQREIFTTIVDGLAAAEVLGKLDIFVLEATAVAISRLRQINAMVNEDERYLSNSALQGARARYQQDMWRGCNELCLSPQARAKMGTLAAQAVKAKEDPLKRALMDDD